MIPKLTPEQREALHLHGSPIAVEDQETQRVYFLVDSTMLESIREQGDVAAILAGIDDAESGRVEPLDRAIQKIEEQLRTRFAT